MRLCVIGTGYVGLVAGAGFSDMGNEVVCCDIDADKIAGLRRGEMPIYEPGLDKLVARNAADGRLSFSTDVAAGVAGAQIVVLAVGTPAGPDGAADLSYVFSAAETVAKSLTGYAVVVTKSTVPVGTGDKVEAIMKPFARHPFSVASNPEFLKEGAALDDFMKPDRIVIGTNDDRARDALKSLYAPFMRTQDRVMFMDRRSAELTKYAANSMLATRISFMNELANLCDSIGTDIELVRHGMGADQRIGPKFLYPGPGFGGSCFPKDLRALISTGREAGHRLSVIESVAAVNEAQKHVLAGKIRDHFKGDLAGKRIAVWGLAFKPGTDDIREAPALVLIDDLVAEGATIVATDPVAIPAVSRVLGVRKNVRLEPSHYAAAKDADALVLVTEWHEYRRPTFSKLKTTMRGTALFDGRNVWDASEARTAGFTYQGIGRGRPQD